MEAEIEKRIVELNDQLLNDLLDYRANHPEFVFSLRSRGSRRSEEDDEGESRLERGYWFPGSHYIFIGFYIPNDWKNKTRSFGFVVNMQNPEEPLNYIEWVYNAPAKEEHLPFYEGLYKIFPNAKREVSNKARVYFDTNNYTKNLRTFLMRDKPQVDDLIRELKLENDFFIPEERFLRNLERVMECRNNLLQSALRPTFDGSSNIRRFSLNTILYGPPGTGKTYNSIDLAVTLANGKSSDHKSNKAEFDRLRKEGQIEFVTFHQNYTYEDFMVGIKPELTGTSQLQFRKWEGIFYKICKRAEQNYLSNREPSETLKPFEQVISTFLRPLQENGEEIEIKMASDKASFWITDINPSNLGFRKQSGGTEHTLSLDTIKELYEGTRQFTSGLKYYYVPLLDKLWSIGKNEKSKVDLLNYVLVIDEINRANISKVFGELITLLEDDKRIGRDNELRVSLPNGERDFGIPSNLYVIGTMNTADKSIALIDIALRRRFEFRGFYPMYEGYNPEAAALLEKINEKIYSLKNSSDYLIGHAYFMNGSSIELTLRNKVIPLLMEYFSGKINLVSDIFKDTDWSVSYNSKTYSWDILSKAE